MNRRFVYPIDFSIASCTTTSLLCKSFKELFLNMLDEWFISRKRMQRYGKNQYAPNISAKKSLNITSINKHLSKYLWLQTFVNTNPLQFILISMFTNQQRMEWLKNVTPYYIYKERVEKILCYANYLLISQPKWTKWRKNKGTRQWPLSARKTRSLSW